MGGRLFALSIVEHSMFSGPLPLPFPYFYDLDVL
jgi:hypothetical protein